MVQRRSRGCVSPAHARISANATWLRGMIAVADYLGASKPEWYCKFEDSGFKPAVPLGSSATARPTKGACWVGLGRVG